MTEGEKARKEGLLPALLKLTVFQEALQNKELSFPGEICKATVVFQWE